MATTKTTAPQSAAAPVLDLTPHMAKANWPAHQGQTTPVLIVNPAASLSQRVALAYAMCEELRGMVDYAFMAAEDQDHDRSLKAALALDERVDVLCRLMSDVGTRAVDQEGAGK